MRRISGYYRMFGRYVSGRLLFIASAAVIAAGILYLSLGHGRVMAVWYSRQTLPDFPLDSPYLAGYTGQARLVLPDGSVLYEGEISGASAEGRGRLYSGGRLLYEGMFSGNAYSGYGTLYSSGGLPLYAGSFAENLYHGNGSLYNENGGLIYEGGFENGIYQGRGTLHFVENGVDYTYTGDFSEGIRSGSGQLSGGDGLLYEGGFSEGLFSGPGRLYEHGVLLYEGGFAEGKYEGMGNLFGNGALLYAGEFSQGLYNGEGTEYSVKTGFKAFEGRYLAGERMTAGTVYGSGGLALTEPVQVFDPSSLLGVTYEEACADLTEMGADFRVIPPVDGLLMLVDDSDGCIYAFATDEESGKPLYLACLYLCGMSASHGVVVGSDVRHVELDFFMEALPGTLQAPQDALALSLSNLCWGRSVSMTEMGCVAFITAEDTLVTAYYLPPSDGSPGAKSAQGQILFLRVE